MTDKMTSEEALKKVRGYLTDYFSITDYNEVEEIMLALEQQPCEDAISREEVRNIIIKDNEMYGYSDRTHDLMEKILELPSVTPSYNSIKTELKHCEDFNSEIKCSEE